MYTNVRIADSVVTNEDYAKRAAELGHGIISTMEHGWQGRYIEGYELAQKYNLKFVFGTEAYWVKDRQKEYPSENNPDKLLKDSSNCHICIFARNENGRQAINDILSEANITGYYIRPRIDLPLIFSLPPEDVIVTTACVAYWKYEDIDEITEQFRDYFGKNFYLEVQYHNTPLQRDINRHILELSEKLNIPLIMGCDSHYIYEDQAWERTDFLASKGIEYPEEEGWYMDYPDGATAYKRFADQCVLSHDQIIEAMNNTNVFLEVEEYDSPVFNHEVKLPTIYPELSQEERDKKFTELVWNLWEDQKHEVPKEMWPHYVSEIMNEVDTVVTSHTADYFLLDYEIVKLAKSRGGELTPTGRGSSPSFYINKLFGFTLIDRIAAKVKMYPERFMSAVRILQTKSLPDIDMNVSSPEIFWQAQKDIIGENHAYQMIAYGTMAPLAAWKMYAKASGVDFDTANEVSNQIKKWQIAVKHADEEDKDDIDVFDYIQPQYHKIYQRSERYRGIVSSWSIHPCFTGEELVYTDKGYKYIKDIEVGDYVLDVDKNYSKVINTQQSLSKDLYHVTFQNVGKIEATGNHPFYVAGSYRKQNKRYLLEPEWKQVSELQEGDYVAIPLEECKNIIPKYEDLPTDSKDFWWYIGRYLGDGWLKARYEDRPSEYIITLCCNNKDSSEAEEIKSHLNAIGKYHYWIDNRRTTYNFLICNKNLYNFLLQFGKGSTNKILTNDVLNLPKEYLEVFLQGYLSADGHIAKTGHITFSSVSKHLAYGIAKCVHLVYQVPCTISERIAVPSVVDGGRKIISKNIQYCGRFKHNPEHHTTYLKDKKYIWVAFKKREKAIGIHYVYNMEVENSHSYTVNNVIVHNCASIVYSGDIRREIGLTYVKSATSKEGILCAVMDGKWAEEYKFLKNDWLTVQVVKLMYRLYRRIGMEVPSVEQLLQMCATDDGKAWSIYKRKCTLGINQVEQPGTAARVGTYAPTNISELCAFVAAIRPGFKSMYKIFESRQSFSYNIPSFDALIQTEEMPNSFVLYQEMAMAALNYAGIDMAECYAVIKNIAKKRVEKVLAYKNQFVSGFAQKIMAAEHKSQQESDKLAHQVWQILEDSSRYSFNASHSYCVSLDGLYCAWVKAHYPLEFYEVYMQLQDENSKKDKVKQAQLEAEQYFNITFPPYRYGQDNTHIAANPENNSITNSMKSIKGFNQSTSEILLECSRQTQFHYFIELLLYLKQTYRVTPTRIMPLIKIGYFQEFGNIPTLVAITDAFEFLKEGEAKKIAKDKLKDQVFADVIRTCCSDLKKDGTPAKSYTLPENMVERDHLFRAIEDYIRQLNLPDITFKEKINYQLEVLGYIDLTTNKKEDIRKLVVISTFPLRSKNSKAIWAYVLDVKSIGTGKICSLTVDKQIFEQCPLSEADVIYADKLSKNKKGYWYLEKYWKLEGDKI